MRNPARILFFLLLISAILFFAETGSLRAGYKEGHPEYPRLTTRTLGMGGASVAFIDDGTSIFQNPAGLGRIRSLTISHAHSRNHFPGEIENLDQLDADPTSFIVPLSGGFFGFPIGSAGTGWVLQGELGYDYRTRNSDDIPEERLFGMGPGDRYEGAGFHLWPGGYFGFAHRMSEYLFTSGDELPDGVTWRRSGEGYSAGVQQTIISGLQFGAVFEQVDYDYLPYRDGITGERTKSFRQGWAVMPTAWLTIAKDSEKIDLKKWFADESMEASVTETVRNYFGVEIKLGQWFAVRFGDLDGHAAAGWSYKIGPWRSDSAWVDGLMNEMVGDFPEPDPSNSLHQLDSEHDISDYHPTGFNLGS